MTFYILDDHIGAVQVLQRIVQKNELGTVLGTNTDPEKAIQEILDLSPDIVLIDLLMPKMDGISVVKKIHPVNPDINFIMISQVVDKPLIQDAYEAGIEFYITKPNNVIEIKQVINNIIEKRKMAQALAGIRNIMGKESDAANSDGAPASTAAFSNKVRRILGSIGMLGETGTKDIVAIMEELAKDGKSYESKNSIDSYAKTLDAEAKIVRQRIRRAIKKGLTNLASLGVEDYYNEIFSDYGNTLFDFESVRLEMDLLRGKGDVGGSPSIDKFFEGLELLCNQ